MEEHKVITDDGRVLWAVGQGRGEPPLVLCHGDAGPPDVFDGLVGLLADRVRVIRWHQRDDPGCPTARAVADLDSVRAHFGLAEMALLGQGGGADVALHYALAHPGRVSSLVYVPGVGLDEPGLVARCRGLDVPTLIVDGAADVRPRWAVDSLAEALPDVARVVLPGAGDVPWVGSPGSFGWAVLAHLAR
ncbi:hypothetical protein FHX81_6451 [Saccharothrix saharensis]|uniref:Alpha/beta hydrolase family protein n=1 Tax=Saccharothrix saharensis TaxID=571190 RepID=A0A543JML2_9PSEU|nr:alpha/beta hydrolase [Saccharothrix saharensis]TQM84014.1 hypothetical protein FHX81_6451 [Saccharothrix saharensis]